MTQQTITEEGALQYTNRTQINENFEELYGQVVLADKATWKVAEISLGAAELGGSETNTSFSFPTNGAILLNAWLNITDGEAGTVDVGTQGTSNDPNGIMEAAVTTTAGYRATVAGALLGKFITGGDPVSVTSSGDLNSCSGLLYISYLELPAA